MTKAAQAQYADALAWIDRNRDAWAKIIVPTALDMAERGRHIGARYLLERARFESNLAQPSGLDGDVFKASNDHAPVIGRLLWRDYPAVRPFVSIRRCPDLDRLCGLFIGVDGKPRLLDDAEGGGSDGE